VTEPLLTAVIEAVARHYSADPASLTSPRRVTSHVVARHTAMYVARLVGHFSYAQIAEAFHRKDHTTILSACKKMTRLSIEDKEYGRVVDGLVAELQGMRKSGRPVQVRSELIGLIEHRVRQGIYGSSVEDEVDRILCDFFQRERRFK
jgi:hypothetical protein